jgi:hypothetical protein
MGADLMPLSDAGQNAIRSAYNRKIEDLVGKISDRSIVVLIYRIVETQSIHIDDRKALLTSLLIEDEDIQILFDYADDLFGEFYATIYSD